MKKLPGTLGPAATRTLLFQQQAALPENGGFSRSFPLEQENSRAPARFGSFPLVHSNTTEHLISHIHQIDISDQE